MISASQSGVALPRRAVLGPVAAAMKMIEADGTVADAAAVMAKLTGIPGLDNKAIVAEAIIEVRRIRAAVESTS